MRAWQLVIAVEEGWTEQGAAGADRTEELGSAGAHG